MYDREQQSTFEKGKGSGNQSNSQPPQQIEAMGARMDGNETFNLLGHTGNNLYQTVVPDLMRVYDNLTSQSNDGSEQIVQHPTRESDYRYSVDSTSLAAQPRDDVYHYQKQSENYARSEEVTDQNNTFSSLLYSNQALPGQSYGETSHPAPSGSSLPPQHDYLEQSSTGSIAIGMSHYPQSPLPHPRLPPMGYEVGPVHNVQPQPQPQPQSSGYLLGVDRNDRASTGDFSASISNGTARKKRKVAGRSKRYSWPEELHRDFVSAVFDVGLKHSSPSAILEHMAKDDQLTSERVKSHLQKYSLQREKSTGEFVSAYDAALQMMKREPHGDQDPQSLSSGEVAAYLTFSTSGCSIPPLSGVKDGRATSSSQQRETLVLPKLTDEEKNSPMGAAFGYVLGLFLALRQQLFSQRGGEKEIEQR